MDNGRAVLHINGAEYQLVDQFTGPSSGTFQNLEARIERMVKGDDTQMQRFQVLIGGNSGVLMVHPSDHLVSAVLVFVPAPAPQVY